MISKFRFGIRHSQIFVGESSHRRVVHNYRSAVGSIQVQSADSYSFHDRRFLVSSLSKRPYKVFQSFRECFYFQKSREISVPATSQVTHFFEISPCVRERNVSEYMLAVFSPFSLIHILASLLRVPSSPQFGALVETGGQKGSQIRAGDH